MLSELSKIKSTRFKDNNLSECIYSKYFLPIVLKTKNNPEWNVIVEMFVRFKCENQALVEDKREIMINTLKHLSYERMIDEAG